MAASITTGKTWSTGESCTAAKLNTMFTGASVSGIINSEIASAAEIALSKLTTAASDTTLDLALENYLDGCYIFRQDGDNIGVSVGSAMINGKFRRNTSAITNVTYSAPDDDDWLDVWILADAAATTFTAQAVDSGTVPGGSSNPGTNGRMIGSFKFIDSTVKISMYRQYRSDHITGFDYSIGNSAQNLDLVVTIGKTMDVATRPYVWNLGQSNSEPNEVSDHNANPKAQGIGANTITTTAFTAESRLETGDTHSGVTFYSWLWRVDGTYT